MNIDINDSIIEHLYSLIVSNFLKYFNTNANSINTIIPQRIRYPYISILIKLI